MEIKEKLKQIIKNLEQRGETNVEIVQYLTYIIEGIGKVYPEVVSEYLDITLENQHASNRSIA